MKKTQGLRSIVTVCLLLFTGFIGVISFEPEVVSAGNKTLYVGGSGPGNYTRIQDAIDDAENGDTIFVYNGYYYENIEISKLITLVGENNKETLIYGDSYYDNIILITTNNVTLLNFKIKDGSRYNGGNSGLELNEVHDCTIKNLIIDSLEGKGIHLFKSFNNKIIKNNISSNDDEGLFLQHSSNNYISGNNISKCYREGIKLENSSNNTFGNNSINSNSFSGLSIGSSQNNSIKNNKIKSNSYSGIYIGYSTRTKIENNDISANDYYSGISIYYSLNTHIIQNNLIYDGISIQGNSQHFSTTNISTNNLVNKKSVYFFKNRNQMEIKSLPAGQIILYNCSDFILSNIYINDTDNGILIKQSQNISIKDSRIVNNSIGINIDSSTNCIISFNNLSNNKYGLLASLLNETSILSNSFSLNSNHGILISESFFNDIKSNNIIGNEGVGIHLDKSQNNQVKDNTIALNPEGGLILENSLNNFLISNNFSSEGILLLGSLQAHYNSHTITSNNTLNGKQVFYFSNQMGLRLNQKNVGQLFIVNCSNLEIDNIQINHSFSAIKIVNSSHINISKSIISNNNENGIDIHSSSNINIKSNQIANNDLNGISMHSSNDTIISNNTIISNEENGIYLRDSKKNEITNNKLIVGVARTRCKVNIHI